MKWIPAVRLAGECPIDIIHIETQYEDYYLVLLCESKRDSAMIHLRQCNINAAYVQYSLQATRIVKVLTSYLT
jgi:hypothetical protein